jgi:diaminohydroxyphosphoribosylaminopyrimidine deaminase/5-amino-6-(5-phosphoribosylamino)uracil reductase
MLELERRLTIWSFLIPHNMSIAYSDDKFPKCRSTLKVPTENKAVWNDDDHRLMARALELAALGVGQVSPGPLVGCVIVDPDGKLAGEGHYIYQDIKHAETVALGLAGSRARGGTAYVSLEPHAHFGRTPPCTDALIQAGIKRVVAPIEDLNPEVSGSGFAHLRAAGIKVEIGLLAQEAEQLNEKYLHFMRTGRPFVHLKLAVSLDGKIATRSGDSRWVAGKESLARAHQLRHESDAIVIGANTAAIDDPLLTDRSGLKRRRPLIRVVLDDDLTLSADSQLANTVDQGPVLVFTGNEPHLDSLRDLTSKGVEVIRTEGRDLLAVLLQLGSRSLQGILVEGGAGVAGQFIDDALIDKVTFFVAPKIIGGREAPGAVGGKGIERMCDALELEDLEVHHRGNDLEVTGYPRRKDEG